jgi:hypothetical protein
MSETAKREPASREGTRQRPAVVAESRLAEQSPRVAPETSGLAEALATAGPETRARTVKGLQSSCGNVAVQRLLAVQRGDYPWSGPRVDALSSVLWDVAGMIPGVGTVSNAAGLAIDAGTYGIDRLMGDEESASRHAHSMELDALGMIPGVGTALGMAQTGIDAAAMYDRIQGVPVSEAPLAGDIYHELRNSPGGGGGAGPVRHDVFSENEWI